MVTFEELHEQNHKITELSNILSTLICDRSVIDNEITGELFFRYVDSVKEHFDLENKHLISELLQGHDQESKNVANLFLSGASEIRRLFDKYLRKWCKKGGLRVGQHDKFVQETEEMLELVLNRIEDETEKLYPLVRKQREQESSAA